MTTCEKCGTRMSEDERACPVCGTEAQAADTTMNDGTTAEGWPEGALGNEVASAETARAESADENPEIVNESDAVAPVASSSSAKPVAAMPSAPVMKASAGGGLSSTTKALIVAGIAIVAAAGLLFWQVKGNKSAAVNLTSDDMTEIVKTMLPPQQLNILAKDEEKRKDLAKQFRQLLAIAQDARASGLTDSPDMRRQLDLIRTFVIAQLYAKKQQEAGVTSQEQLFSKEETDKFLNAPGQDQKFEEFIKDVQALGLLPSAQALADQQKERIKNELWAPTQVLSQKAIAAGVDKERVTQLLVEFQQAQILAQKHAPKILERTKPTDQEIDDYIAKHPELDDKQARAKAQDIVRRARGGEDFAALAKEFSIDGSKEEGGELGWFKHEAMVKPFADAAFAMQPGQISDVVESQFGFHIIQTEEKRTAKGEDGKDVEEVRARHILIPSSGDGQPSNPMAPPQSGREKARAAIEKEKRDKLLEEIAQRTHVNVAENYKVEAPPALPQQTQLPPGVAPGDDGEGLPPELSQPGGADGARKPATKPTAKPLAKPKK